MRRDRWRSGSSARVLFFCMVTFCGGGFSFFPLTLRVFMNYVHYISPHLSVHHLHFTAPPHRAYAYLFTIALSRRLRLLDKHSDGTGSFYWNRLLMCVKSLYRWNTFLWSTGLERWQGNESISMFIEPIIDCERMLTDFLEKVGGGIRGSRKTIFFKWESD